MAVVVDVRTGDPVAETIMDKFATAEDSAAASLLAFSSDFQLTGSFQMMLPERPVQIFVNSKLAVVTKHSLTVYS